MKTFEKVQVEQEQLSTITCNKCGVTARITNDLTGLAGENQFQQFELHFGYGSNYDDETWTFDLCEDCLNEFTSTFAIPKQVEQR